MSSKIASFRPRLGLIMIALQAAVLASFDVAGAFHFPWDQGHDTCSPQDEGSPGTPPGPPCGPCEGTAGSPHLDGGNLVKTYTDIVFTTAGEPVAFSRTYNSEDDRNGAMGKGWTLNYELQAIPVYDGVKNAVIVRLANGQRFRFEEKPDGSFTPPIGRHETLVRNANGSHDLHWGNGVVYEFAADTTLRSIVDANGNRISFEYNPTIGCLQRIVDEASGRSIELTVGSNGKITRAVDPAGNAYRYAYDASDRLVSVTGPLGNQTSYTYDSSDRLTRVTDPRGVALIDVVYDSRGRSSEYAALGARLLIEYQTQKTIRRDSAGNAWTFEFPPGGPIGKVIDPLGNTYSRAFDASFNIISETDQNGFVTKFGYDARGNRTSVEDAGGNVSRYEYHPELDFVTSYRDPLGAVQTYEYDDRGNLVRVVSDAGGAEEVVASEYEYDSRGLLLSTTDANGNTRSFEYDSSGNVTKYTDALGQVRTQTYDELGRVLSRTDPLGRTDRFEYDALGRLVAVTDALAQRTTFEWDASGNLASFTNALLGKTRMQYNLRNLLTQVTDPGGHVSLRSYDSRNNKLTRLTDPEGNAVSYVYDGANRLIRIDNALGHSMRYTLDGIGAPIAVEGADGSAWSIAYGFHQQPTKVTDPLGAETTYAYDGRRLRLSRTDANGHQTSFAYDRLGRLTGITDPRGRQWAFEHDDFGNLVSRTDPLGRTIAFAFDALHRLTTTTYPDSTTATRSYDALGNLVRLLDPFTDLEMTYDERRRLTALTDRRLGKTVRYGYDALDRRSSMTGPEGEVTTYTYDLDSLLVKIQRGTEIVAHAYKPDHSLAETTLPNGTKRQYTYDAADRLVNLVHRRSDGTVLQSFDYQHDLAGNITSIVRENADTIAYGYDAAHRLIEEVRTGNVSYAHAYTYDAVGNRLTFGTGCSGGTCSATTRYTYDAADQLVQEVQPTATVDYQHDANGNLVGKTRGSDAWAFGYDLENRLVAVDAPGTSNDVTYEYDGDGKRVTTTVGGLSQRFFYERADDFYVRNPAAKSSMMLNRWLAGTNVLAEYDSAGNVVAGYLNDLEIDSPVSRTPSGGAPAYYLRNHINSVTGMVDGAQSLVNTYDYSAYGLVEEIVEGVENPYLFTSRQLDRESDLYFMRNRYYDPSVGRFLSRDPLLEFLDRTQQISEESSPLFDQTLQPHAYGYGLDNPVMENDPTGTISLFFIVCSAGLPVCSAALFCSANVGACSGGVVCSANIGACSASIAGCSASAGGVCSASAGACSGTADVIGFGACSAAAVCSGDVSVIGAGACSASIFACSAQAGVAGAALCSANLVGACSGQAGAVGASACSGQMAGTCSGQLGGQASLCSGQMAGACSAQFGVGNGYSGCSMQGGGACSAQGGVGGSALGGWGGNGCSAQLGGSCSAQAGGGACSAMLQGSCSAKVDAAGSCCAVIDVEERPTRLAATEKRELGWRDVVSALDVDRRDDGAVSVVWSATPFLQDGEFTLLRWSESDQRWDLIDRRPGVPGRMEEVVDREAGAEARSYLVQVRVGGQTLDLGPFEVDPTAGPPLAWEGGWRWILGALRDVIGSIDT